MSFVFACVVGKFIGAGDIGEVPFSLLVVFVIITL
jgi:hypothetical protein